MFFPADDATEEDWPLSPPPARRVVGLGLPRPSGNPHRGPRSPQHLRMLRPPEVTADSTLNLGASACLDPTRCGQLHDKVGSDEKRARAPRTSESGGGLDDSTLQLVLILSSSCPHPPLDGPARLPARAETPHTPTIWTSMPRDRGPSSSANTMDWNRPSDSSPPLIPTATLRPRSAARRCAAAFPRSQSE